MPEDAGGASYAEAGVDRAAAERATSRIEDLVRATHGPEVLSEPGSFGGRFRLADAPSAPVLVASADGVGTKLKVAIRAGRHDTIGRDLVHHCINDILVEGARPLFFLDYIGMGTLDEAAVEQIVAGLAAACREAGCALLGGETAEMPDFYSPGDYDLAGFILGAADQDTHIGPERVRAGNVLIGLGSNGFHTNGYSLLRHVLFERMGLGVDDEIPGLGEGVGELLLRMHRSYLEPVLPLVRAGRVHAVAHVTGGGIPGNLERAAPEGLEARVDRSTWQTPPAFRSVMEHGGIAEPEMWHTFNMGVGMVLIAPAGAGTELVEELTEAGEDAWVMGEVEEGDERVVLL